MSVRNVKQDCLVPFIKMENLGFTQNRQDVQSADLTVGIISLG
jgi:hypothetical protein